MKLTVYDKRIAEIEKRIVDRIPHPDFSDVSDQELDYFEALFDEHGAADSYRLLGMLSDEEADRCRVILEKIEWRGK